VEAFVRQKLDEKKATLRDWEARYGVQGFGGVRRKAGEIQGMEEVLKFMVQNRK
tara:strand:+ start:1055 stop:1216 length:162 start_codon:yes stop_codon:yes gene_type:complete